MAFTLAPEALAAGYGIVVFETIGSTNEEAAARGRSGDTGPVWIVSPHQSGGRGRRGGNWQTPSGNLAASLLLSTDAPPATAATLGFVAGLALVRALDTCCGPGASFEAGLRPAPQDEERGGSQPGARTPPQTQHGAMRFSSVFGTRRR